jgi:hypothetical protein
MKALVTLAGVLGLALAGLAAQPPAPPPAPDVTIELGPRQAQGTPARAGFSHTGGGNIDVQQPGADAVVVTMTGVAVAGGHPCKDSLAALAFDLVQEFEVKPANPDIKRAKLTLEARVIGLLRSHAKGGGSAGITCPAHAAVTPCAAGGPALVEVGLQGRTVASGENLTVNDKVGPVAAGLPAGRYTLHQLFGVQASHPAKLLPCQAASAEFAPDPALDPLWISAFEPFHGAQKKDFGFQVIVRVSPE